MASERQVRANRLNALKSTGPRTADGKRASARNAVRHGLTSVRAVLDGEDAALYEALLRELLHEFQPISVLDNMLVQQLANVMWRLRRSTVYEAALVTWIAHLQSQTHDTQGVILGQTFVPLNTWGLGPQVADRSGCGAHASSARDMLHAGRTLEAALGKNELLSKLSRYETHLIRQMTRILGQISTT